MHPMEIEIWQIMVALATGSAAGMFYFGGLWLTVQRIATSDRPQRLLVVSFFLRLAFSLVAFYLLVPWGWPALTTALAGLMVTRQILTKRKGNPSAAAS